VRWQAQHNFECKTQHFGNESEMSCQTTAEKEMNSATRTLMALDFANWVFCLFCDLCVIISVFKPGTAKCGKIRLTFPSFLRGFCLHF